jgi:hypothetical protein
MTEPSFTLDQYFDMWASAMLKNSTPEELREHLEPVRLVRSHYGVSGMMMRDRHTGEEHLIEIETVTPSPKRRR